MAYSLSAQSSQRTRCRISFSFSECVLQAHRPHSKTCRPQKLDWICLLRANVTIYRACSTLLLSLGFLRAFPPAGPDVRGSNPADSSGRAVCRFQHASEALDDLTSGGST